MVGVQTLQLNLTNGINKKTVKVRSIQLLRMYQGQSHLGSCCRDKHHDQK